MRADSPTHLPTQLEGLALGDFLLKHPGLGYIHIWCYIHIIFQKVKHIFIFDFLLYMNFQHSSQFLVISESLTSLRCALSVLSLRLENREVTGFLVVGRKAGTVNVWPLDNNRNVTLLTWMFPDSKMLAQHKWFCLHSTDIFERRVQDSVNHTDVSNTWRSVLEYLERACIAWNYCCVTSHYGGILLSPESVSLHSHRKHRWEYVPTCGWYVRMLGGGLEGGAPSKNKWFCFIVGLFLFCFVYLLILIMWLFRSDNPDCPLIQQTCKKTLKGHFSTRQPSPTVTTVLTSSLIVQACSCVPFSGARVMLL